MGDLGEGVIFSSYLPPQSPARIKFSQRFQTLYGIKPGILASDIYDATNIVLKSIHIAHNDKINLFNGALIRHYIQGTKNYPGVSGTITFNQSGDVVSKRVTLLQVQGKSFKTMGNFTVIDNQLILLP